MWIFTHAVGCVWGDSFKHEQINQSSINSNSGFINNTKTWFSLKGDELEEMEHFKYLGSNKGKVGETDEDIQEWRKQRQTFWKSKVIAKNIKF